VRWTAGVDLGYRYRAYYIRIDDDIWGSIWRAEEDERKSE
jgi:hypothetical protein